MAAPLMGDDIAPCSPRSGHDEDAEETKKALIALLFALQPKPSVDLVGVEPTSAQGNHMLSTRLFQTLIFVIWQDLNHQPYPYPLKFHRGIEAYNDYFRFICTAWPTRFGTTSVERCLVPSPCDGIKPVIYCTSIRQRERNCFRQLICVR